MESSARTNGSAQPSSPTSHAQFADAAKFFVARGAVDAPIPVMTRTCAAVALKTRVATFGTAALLALGACAGSASTQPTHGAAKTGLQTTTSTTSATSTTNSRTQLVAAVRAFWNLYLQLGGRAELFNGADIRARLRARTAGAELTRLSDVFEANAAAGLVVKGTIAVSPSVVSITGTTAVVRDCFDDNTGLYRVSDGRRLDTKDPHRHAVYISLTRAAGVWKVFAMRNDGLGCAA